MEALLRNPAGLIAVLCLIGAVIAPLLVIVIMLRGGTVSVEPLRRYFVSEAHILRKTVTGATEAHHQQSDQLAELRRRVNEIQSTEPPPPP
jgi:hypothetical protein